MNGASNCQLTRVEIVFMLPKGIQLERFFRLDFHASNNKTEYEALLVGLQMAKQAKAAKLRLQCDIRLVFN